MTEEQLKVPWYAGHEDGSVTVIQGLQETPLPHHVKHSPTGFGWGYGGSGPAELARCLLIHALGEQAKCTVCDGTGQIVYGPEPEGKEMSVAEAEAHYTADQVDFDSVYTCHYCEDGIAVTPAMYQQFKFDVVAKFPAGEPWRGTEITSTREDGRGTVISLSPTSENRWHAWSMPQPEVLNWVRRYRLEHPEGC